MRACRLFRTVRFPNGAKQRVCNRVLAGAQEDLCQNPWVGRRPETMGKCGKAGVLMPLGLGLSEGTHAILAGVLY